MYHVIRLSLPGFCKSAQSLDTLSADDLAAHPEATYARCSVSQVAHVLPDILRPGLRVVFCGTAAGTASAKAKTYYAGPGNAFWATLHATGMTPVLLLPTEFERLSEFGIGLTDICKVRHGSDEEVGTTEFDVAGLEVKIGQAEPACLAFNGKNAAKGVLGRAVDYGRQPERIGGAETWVLPSTSGAARAFWDPRPWHELARTCGSPSIGASVNLKKASIGELLALSRQVLAEFSGDSPGSVESGTKFGTKFRNRAPYSRGFRDARS